MVDPEKFATALERRAGDRRRAARGRRRTRRSSSARELWRETRIALFEQATDTRPEELKAQGVRPRVWFGERWITSIFDLFEENVTYFPALLPVCEPEDPVEVLDAGGVPAPRRAAAPQRHRLPLEPAGLRRRPRQAAPAGREPRAARRADRGRHARQRRLLLRARAHAGRRGPPDLVADVVLGRRGELPRRRARRHRRERVLARARRGAGLRARAAAAAAARPRGARRAGARRRRPRPPARHHRAALHEAAQRRDLAGRDVPPPLRRQGARARAGAARDDGPLPRPHARQRAGPRLAGRRDVTRRRSGRRASGRCRSARRPRASSPRRRR